MRCSVCGADNLEGAVYCEDCGARLPGAGSAPPTPAVTPAPPSPPPAPPTPVEAPPAAAEAPAPAASAGGACAACGAQNLPGVAFCEDCGASLAPGGVDPVSSQPPVSYDAPTPVAPPQPPPAQDTSRRARLVHTSGKEFFLDKDTNLIGRRSPVDGIFPEVDLTDYDTESYISRRHAKLLLGETGILFEDLGSSNGSFLNGARMQSGVQQMVRDGDSLRLGKTEMVLRCN